MVLPDSHEVPRASQYSGTGCVLFGFVYGAVTRYGGAFQLASPAYSGITYAGPTTPAERIQPELNFLNVSAKALSLRSAASIHCRNFTHDPFDEPVHIEEHIVGSRLASLNHGLAFVRHDRPREG